PIAASTREHVKRWIIAIICSPRGNARPQQATARNSRVFWAAQVKVGCLGSFFSAEACERDGVDTQRYIGLMAEVRSEFSLEPIRFLRSFYMSYTKAGFEFTRRVFQIADGSLSPVIEAINESGILGTAIPLSGEFEDYHGDPYIESLAKHFPEHRGLEDLIRKRLADAGSAVRLEFGLSGPRQLEHACDKLWAGVHLEYLRARNLTESIWPLPVAPHDESPPSNAGA
ncbi:MAG: hypothetical protein ACREJM_01980, partial [Candidatus Saccharimonadales bacterium]